MTVSKRTRIQYVSFMCPKCGSIVESLWAPYMGKERSTECVGGGAMCSCTPDEELFDYVVENRPATQDDKARMMRPGTY